MSREPDWATADGRVKLYCGDAIAVLSGFDRGSFDLCITDPPYGIAYSSGHGSEVWGDGSIDGDENTSVRDAALQSDAINGITSLVFGTWKRPAPAGTRAKLVWDTLGALGMGDLRIPWKPSHQEIYVLGDPRGLCGERGSDVIRHPPVQSMAKNGRLHPFEKPVGLIDSLLAKTTGSRVVDPFMGSCPVGMACVMRGREFTGIELEPRYFEIAVKRIKAELERAPLFEAKPTYITRPLFDSP